MNLLMNNHRLLSDSELSETSIEKALKSRLSYVVNGWWLHLKVRYLGGLMVICGRILSELCVWTFQGIETG